jgi:hypothetical protein
MAKSDLVDVIVAFIGPLGKINPMPQSFFAVPALRSDLNFRNNQRLMNESLVFIRLVSAPVL